MLRIGRLGETLVAAVQLNDGTIALLTNGAAECSITVRTEQPDTSGNASRVVTDDWEERERAFMEKVARAAREGFTEQDHGGSALIPLNDLKRRRARAIIDDRPPHLGREGA